MWTGILLFFTILTAFIFCGCFAAFQPSDTAPDEPCVTEGISTVARGTCMVCKQCDHTRVIAMNCTRDGERFVGDEQQLYEDLFPGQKYNTGLRPLYNSSDQIRVLFTMQVKQVVDIDERNQMLRLNILLNQSWYDSFLQWDPDEYGGLTELRVPANEVWMPDTTLYNTGEASHPFSNSSMTNAVLHYSGRVLVVSKPYVQTSTCKIDIKFFPFDVQHCHLKFGLWTFDWNHVDLYNITAGPTYPDDGVRNEQWDISYGTFCRHVIKYDCCSERYVDVTVYLGLERKPLYYMYKLVMPILLLSALSMVGFLMPYNVGVVKANLSVTLILSMTVFQLLVAETIPRTSEGLPLISEYYIIIMVLIAVSTAMNVGVLNIFHRHQDKMEVHEVPRWLRTIALKYLAKLLCMECARRDLLTRVEQEEKVDANRMAMLKKQRWLAARYNTSYAPLAHESTLNHARNCNVNTGLNLLNFGLDNGRSRNNNHHDLDAFAENLTDDADVRLTKLETNTDGILRHLRTARRRQDKAHRVQREWALVATVTDRLLFCFYACFTITMSLVVLWIRPSMQNSDKYSVINQGGCNSTNQLFEE